MSKTRNVVIGGVNVVIKRCNMPESEETALCDHQEGRHRNWRAWTCRCQKLHAVSPRSCRIVVAPEFPLAPVVPSQAQDEGVVSFDIRLASGDRDSHSFR